MRLALLFAIGVLAAIAQQTLRAQPVLAPRVAELFEDDAEELLKKLTNPTGDSGEGRVEKAVVFSGKTSIKIIPMQRFHPQIPGWKYRIAKAPKAGEFRYLRFAWKADGCAGIMIQLHDEKDWFIRYTAGIDQFNWGTRFVAAKPSADWKLVTCDLYKDFGERTITGMALTVFGGQAGYFDHIYLGREVDDLDRIDATGLRRGTPPAPSAADLDRLWQQLADGDHAAAYRAYWTLVAASKQSIPFLKGKLAGPPAKVASQQLRRWIAELGDEQFAAREQATRMLAQHVDAAAPLLEQELTRKPSPEVRTRIGLLLKGRKGLDEDRQRITRAIRALTYISTAEARAALEELARGDGPAAAEIRAALTTLNRSN
ncbi:MAG: hypothetical protein FJ271_25380 [Planctomycetes bacterium]|nr:hypothetical protein [Planctomycetota bacterium]